MKKEIIERYERTVSGEVIIDISAQKIEDLYDNFDKQSHFLKKDLNKGLVEYIIESAREIEKEDFILQFTLETDADPDSIGRVKNSINNFFVYLQEVESRKIKEMMRTSIIFLVIGLAIATISVFMNQSRLVEISVAAAVMAEGLTVAAWVSLWESLAIFLIKWIPHKKTIVLFRRIADAKVIFNPELSNKKLNSIKIRK